MPEPTLRAFVAVELPAEIHDLLETRQNELRGAMGHASGGVRWARAEGVHVTLQFLGNVPASLVPEISAALKEACEGTSPLNLVVGGIGAFPNMGRPRILWIGLEGDTGRLRALASGIGQRLETLGYKPDKPFEPHITLGRVRETVRPDELRAISQGLVAQATQHSLKTSFTIRSVSLMRSHLQPGGSVYTQLATVEFGS
jgi:RNA 2',3'-cyclic 3'-phosphodiesterase